MIKQADPWLFPFGLVFFLAGLGFEIGITFQYFTTGSASSEEPTPLFPAILITLPHVLVGLGVMLYSVNARYEIDDYAIRFYNWLGKMSQEIHWSDVTDFMLHRGVKGLRKSALALRTSSSELSVEKGKHTWPLIDMEIRKHLPKFDVPLGKPASEVTRSRPIIPAEGLVFRDKGSILYGALLPIFGGAMLFGLFNERSEQQSSFATMVFASIAILILGGGLAAIAHAINHRIVLTEESIARYNLLGNVEDEILWSDVEGLYHELHEYGDGGPDDFYIIRTADRYIRFHNGFTNWKRLQDAVIGLLPPSARVDVEQY